MAAIHNNLDGAQKQTNESQMPRVHAICSTATNVKVGTKVTYSDSNQKVPQGKGTGLYLGQNSLNCT
jgi:hypothetical protein